jgi:DNA repair protein RecO (recombination protein O)
MRHSGFVAGGISRKSRPTRQSGNVVEVSWRAKLSEQLGYYTGELREAHAARAMDDASELAGLSAACGLVDAALPEREPHPAIFDGFEALLGALGHPGWPAIYVRLELGVLQELGFGLDLEQCAATGATGDLGYSPRPRPDAPCRGPRPVLIGKSCSPCRPFCPPVDYRPTTRSCARGSI